MKKRMTILSVILTVMILVLIGRLAYIQIIGCRDLSRTASAQQLIALEGANTRGLIFDRNGTPLLGSYREYIFIIPQETFDGEAMNALNGLHAREISNRGTGYRVFASKKYSKKTGRRLIENASAYIIEAGRRYSENQKAVHLLGYVNQQDASGVSGLELMCNEELALLKKKLFTIADVKGNILPGRGLVVSTAMEQDSYVKKGIVTTLDAGMQGAAEQALETSRARGAVVILKCDTGELMASASTPVFDPTRVSTYMNSSKHELVNKAMQGEYPPGSVFKIVVAAAALEKGIRPETAFICKGHETINNRQIKCKTGGETGHGTITFKEAFAQSCNSAFIQLAQQVGAEAILQTAEKMGLGKTALDGYPGEKSGNLMTAHQASGAAIANLAIGQGETLTTPLQVARITNIAAGDGTDPGVHLLIDELESEGTAYYPSISRETAAILRQMMAQTMLTGSGRDLKADVSMGAKSGSAESFMGGRPVVHGWMTGVVPAENPEYTITVFVEEGQSGSRSAGPIFAEIAQYLSDTKSFEHAVGF